MLTPAALSIIRTVFTDARERAQAIGFWGATFGASMALGPLVGGALVQALDWRAVFWINLPVGAVALVLTRAFVPESRAPHPRRLDPVGQLLVIATLGLVTFSIIEGPSSGWTSAEILGTFGGALAAAVGLLVYERHRREPLLELRFFRSVPFSGANLIAIATFAALGGFLLLNTIYLQIVRHFSPFESGLYVLPIAAMQLIFAPIAGRLVGRSGSRAPLLLAGVGLTAGALMLTGITATTSTIWLLASYSVFGIGFGLVNTPISATAVNGMPAAQAGVAAGIA